MWQKVLAMAALFACPLVHATPCETTEYQAFDFWLGEWQVATPDGQQAGKNSITREEGMCLLVERWQSVQGGTGQSYNFYDPQSGQWRQVWVSQGIIIDISGGLTAEGAMRLEGDIVYHADGRTAPFVGQWTPNADGTVTQAFTQWDAETETWKPWFTGIYSRAD